MAGVTVCPTPPSPSVSVERAASRINDVVGGNRLNLALSIGRIVIEELYDGDLTVWRSRGVKEYTLRTLAKNPRLGISASSLYRAIAIYELRVRLGDEQLWNELTVCHIRAILGLPESEQRRLLELAADNAWTTVALEDEAAKIRSQTKSSRGGRPRKPRFARQIEYVEKAFANEDVVFGDIEALDSMSTAQRDEIRRRLRFVRERCDELASLLRV